MVATNREKLPVISPNSDSMLSSTEFFNRIDTKRSLQVLSVACEHLGDHGHIARPHDAHFYQRDMAVPQANGSGRQRNRISSTIARVSSAQ